MYKYYLLILSIIILPYTIKGQETQASFKNYSINDGLSQSSVLSILKDSQGFMWFGTNDGLNRFDGKQFKVYTPEIKNNRSINSGSIFDLLEGPNGHIYIATEGGGLNIYDPVQEEFEYFVHDSSNHSIPSNYIYSMCFIDTHKIVITGTKGVSIFNTNNKHFTNYTHTNKSHQKFPRVVANCVFFDKRKTLWVGTYGKGLTYYNSEIDAFENIYNYSIDVNEQAANIINDIEEISEEELLLATNAGLIIFNRKSKSFRLNEKIKTQIFEILIDDQKNIWCSSGNKGILKLSPENILRSYTYSNETQNSIAENSTIALYQDNQGIIWYGMRSGGVGKMSSRQRKFQHINKSTYPSSIPDNNVFSFLEDSEGTIWIGTIDGLSLWNRHTNSFTNWHDNKNFPPISSKRIWCLTEDSQKNIWIGTDNGIHVYNKRTNKIKQYKSIPNTENTLPNNEIFSIHEDTYGNIWVGTYRGLALLNKDKETFTRFQHEETNPKSISFNIVWHIHSDSRGRLWIATGGGLNEYNYLTKQFDRHLFDPNNENSINDNDVVFIGEDSEGYLWLPTRKGLNRFDVNSKKFKRFGIKDGLPNNSIYACIEHGNHIWFTSNKGITRLNKNDFSIKNYDVRHGTQSNEFNIANLKTKDQSILFGGINGFNIFSPDSILEDRYQAPIVFTNIDLNNKKILPQEEHNDILVLKKSISSANEISLSYKEKIFTVHFAALDYHSPELIQYKYRLLPIQKNWININDRNFITLTNLSPNKYELQIQSTNSDQRWSDETKKLKINITPPIWRQKWFYALEVFFIIFVIMGIIKYREKKLQTDTLRLEQTVLERTEEIQAQKEEIAKQRNIANEQRDQIAKQKEKLEQSSDELENKVKLRTEELEKSKRKAEESDRLKSAFLSNMSHEIRTPMNAIIGFSDLLLEESFSAKEKEEFIQLIKANGSSLLDLLNDIIDISMIESKQLAINLKNINLYETLKGIYSGFEKSSLLDQKSKIQYKFVPDSNHNILIKSDPIRLNQILNNLLNNAIKYTEEGYIELGYRVYNNDLSIYVKDSGIGIAPQNIESIFNRFTKVEDDNTQLYRGAGLGLTITKSLIEILRGSISVDSELGKGSSFHINFPNTIIKQKSEEQSVDSNLETDTKWKGKTILVAEDEAANFRYLEIILQKKGFKVLWAENGKEAVNIFTKTPEIELILMDLKMPVLDGYEACFQIKEINASIPIIAQTAFAMHNEREIILQTGFDDYLSKPIRAGSLFQTIKKFLD